MQRIAEPELMDGVEQAFAYTQADFEAPHQHCLDCLRQVLPDLPRAGTALDLGCGPGDITLRFAKAYPHWQVHGLEGAPAMLAQGMAAVTRAGLEGRVKLVQAYLPQGEAPLAQYDLVFSNSLLHHLADPMVLWQSVHRWAAPGAGVFMMDLMRPEGAAIAQALVDQYAADEPEILRRDFYQSLCAAYRIPEVQQQLQASGLGHLQIKPVSDRHWIVWGRHSQGSATINSANCNLKEPNSMCYVPSAKV
ncbi:methyltransferase domain-containing protein [Synechococcales cyanobacterium C]|uniref:Methyltransferase domain-containing protein n=1 Tax=Petrachloros mirabilis ULC683 TaxID=2781853 RepID=A0A8K2A8T3_9CYAN|nr:class I SAM-dependent methyltransferase [Petrachloros mirabilis]NCJ07524.1 methyltransferase domain-containing protein [Petrachloros mirabilis ULC683]